MGAIADKSFLLAVDVVKTCRIIQKRESEFVLTKQLVRSGTSIGANIRESEGAVSAADFRNKIAIAYKEARETRYWLEVTYSAGIMSKVEFEPLSALCEELCKMLGASKLTLEKR